MVAPLLVAGAVAPSLISAGAGLLGKKKTSQVPLETPQQRAARQMLTDFASTGKFGNFTAGEDIGLGYGDFNATGLETSGLSSLQKLLNGGIPDQYKMGDQALKGFLTSDPNQIQASFDPFKAQVERQIAESNRALKRNAGFAGNLFSTNTIRGLGDIQARGNETLTAQLANLTNQALDRNLSAIPLAYQSGREQEGIQMGRIGASQQYGGLTRMLNDASIKARDAELLRRRQELQMPIDAAKSVAGTPSQFGVPSIETNPLQDLLGLVGKIGGDYAGRALQYQQYKNYFPGSTPGMI